MIRLLCGEETVTMLSCFHRIPERDGQPTDRRNCYINIARQYGCVATGCAPLASFSSSQI